jgi:hypothetical protein
MLAEADPVALVAVIVWVVAVLVSVGVPEINPVEELKLKPEASAGVIA